MRRLLLIAVFVVGCGASEDTGRRPTTAGDETSGSTADAGVGPTDPDASADGGPVLGPNELGRANVAAVVDQGLGRFLRTVEVTPVLERGAFVGFRIVSFRAADGRYSAIDLVPGDVVTRINGSPIERPEQALAIFNGLRVVSELRVEYTRGSERREIRFAIVD